MNGRILRRHGHRCSVLDLEQAFRDRIGRLGREAQQILTAQDQELWKSAAGPDFLPRLVGGALILQRLGQTTTKALVIEDDGAHLAFMTCAALALVARQLDSDLRDELELTIKLLALCCPVEITMEALPPWESLPEPFRSHRIILQQYRSLEEKTGPRDVMLADALALLRIFEKANRPEDAALLSQLTEMTEGLRTALQRVREASSYPSNT